MSLYGAQLVVVVLSLFWEQLLTPETRCKFGNKIVRASFVSENMIECRTPGHAASNVSIFTSMNNQNFIDSGFTYTFHDDLLVHAIAPTFGSTRRYDKMLSGANFIDSGMKCKFGSAEPLFAYYESSSSIMCVTPTIDYMGKLVFTSV